MAPIGDHLARFLLILPPPPSSTSFESLKAAYNATLFSTLKELRYKSPAILEIALPCAHLHNSSSSPRSALYAPTQGLLSNLYKLICIISAKESIDVEDADGLDARIILVAYSRDGRSEMGRGATPAADMQGPIIGITTLARSGRPWEVIFSVETEAGEILLKQFQTAAGKLFTNIHKLRGGITQISTTEPVTAQASAGRRHHSVAVGGTFDHLHIGHKLLLTMTAFMVDDASGNDPDVPRSMTIGITGDQLLVNKKFAEFLGSWEQRKESVWNFYKSTLDFIPGTHDTYKTEIVTNPGPNGHAVNFTLQSGLTVRCVEIWDPFGPTITDESISALVISGETRSGGKAVNDKRKENGWPELEVFEVDVLDADDRSDQLGNSNLEESFQNKLSSTEIRRMLSEKSKAKSKV